MEMVRKLYLAVTHLMTVGSQELFRNVSVVLVPGGEEEVYDRCEG